MRTVSGGLSAVLGWSLLCATVAAEPDTGSGSPADSYPRALTIAQATELAIKVNLDLVAAKFNVSSAEADELTAGLRNNPAVTVDTIFQPFASNWDQTNAGGPRQYDLTLSYPLDLSGKRIASMKSAQAATAIAQAGFLDAVRQKVLQVRLAYIDLLVADYQLGLSKERQDSLSRLVTMIENRIGSTGRLPLLQRRARLALDQAILDTRQRETALRGARSALAILLNRPPLESSVDTASKLRDVPLVTLPAKKSLEDQAIAQRPDLQALRMTYAKAERDHDLARAQVWDNFTVSGALSHQGPTSANPNDPASSSVPGAYSWDASLSIPLPLLNRNQGNIRKALIARDQADKQIQSLMLSIRQEIAVDYDQIALNEGLIKDYEDKQLDNARKVQASQQTLFGTGGSALLDYFDAVNAYQTTVSSYYDVVAEYRRGLARINAALAQDFVP